MLERSNVRKSLWRRRRLYLALVLCLFILTTILWSQTHISRASAAVSASGLHVAGNQLENGSNQVVRALGVNRSGTEYMCTSAGNTSAFDGPNDATSVAAMRSWDITAVRISLNEDCWLGINGYPAARYSSASYQQQIVHYVNMLTSDNLIVILDLHWNNSGTNKATAPEPMPDLDHAPAFWASVASRFKSNSSVIFDLYNEPYAKSWSCWLKGSTAASANPCEDVNFAVAGMQTLVNAVRKTGATNVLMLGGLSWANDLSRWLQNEPNDPVHNLAASFHVYNFNVCSTASCWNTNIAPVAAKVPVITGELGEKDCASSFITTAMNWFDQKGISYLGWAWITKGCSDFPALISNYNGTPTAFGLGLRDHLIAEATSQPVPTPMPTPTPRSHTKPKHHAKPESTPTRSQSPAWRRDPSSGDN